MCRSRTQSESPTHGAALGLFSGTHDKKGGNEPGLSEKLLWKTNPATSCGAMWSELDTDDKGGSCSFSVTMPIPTSQSCVGRKLKMKVGHTLGKAGERGAYSGNSK